MRQGQRAEDGEGTRQLRRRCAGGSGLSEIASGLHGKLGVIGICIGGHLSYRAAMNPEVRAGVCFYATDIHKGSLGKGMCDDSLARSRNLRPRCSWSGAARPARAARGRAIVYNALADAGVHFTWHEFNGQHAFLRDEGARYDPELALKSYGLALELFKRKLGEGDLPAAESGGPKETKH